MIKMPESTLLISKSQIENVLDMRDCVSIIEETFRLYGQGQVQMPPKMYLSFEKGDLRCMPAYVQSLKIAGVKNVNVHPFNQTLPTVMATITLIDPDTGFPLAIMDGTHITNMRTGAAGAVAAKYLSRQDSKTAAFIGAGAQARTQLEALLITRPGICEVTVFDAGEDKMKSFALIAKARFNLDVQPAKSVEDAVRNADIVTTTTPVRAPIVKAEYIRKGTHINAFGADASGKQELDSEILRQSRIVIDNWEQASHSGEINVPLSKGIITRQDIYGDIGEIVTGKKQARQSPDQITVFDSTGLSIQDISVAAEVYQRLVQNKTVQLERFNFL
jgi:alanine dehydrogenase